MSDVVRKNGWSPRSCQGQGRVQAGEETRRLALGWETTGKGMPGCFEALGLDLAYLSVSPPLGDPGQICALQMTVKL